MKKKKANKKASQNIFDTLNFTNKQILTILGVIALAGGSFGGYTVYKNSDALDFQGFFEPSVYMKTVLDGDTFVLENDERIRLSEIDAPEKNECYGKESSEELEKILRGEKLRIVKDVEGADNFGRLIRYVVISKNENREDNIILNKYMLEHGYAKYFTSENKLYKDELMRAQKYAQTNFLGLWGACKDEIAKQAPQKRPLSANDQPRDPKCIIKGNVSDLGYGKTYFLPACTNYTNVKIDFARGDDYFCTGKEAEKAGFKKASGC